MADRFEEWTRCRTIAEWMRIKINHPRNSLANFYTIARAKTKPSITFICHLYLDFTESSYESNLSITSIFATSSLLVGYVLNEHNPMYICIFICCTLYMCVITNYICMHTYYSLDLKQPWYIFKCRFAFVRLTHLHTYEKNLQLTHGKFWVNKLPQYG